MPNGDAALQQTKQELERMRLGGAGEHNNNSTQTRGAASEYNPSSGKGSREVLVPQCTLVVGPVPDEVDGPQFIKALLQCGRLEATLVRGKRQLRQDLALGLVLGSVQGAVPVVVAGQVDGAGKVEYTYGHVDLSGQVDVELTCGNVAVGVVHNDTTVTEEMLARHADALLLRLQSVLVDVLVVGEIVAVK